MNRSTIWTVFIALHFWLWGCSYLCFYFDHTPVGIRSGLSLIPTDSAIPLVIPIVICYVKFLDQFKMLLLLLELMAVEKMMTRQVSQTIVSRWEQNTLSVGCLHNQKELHLWFNRFCPHPAVEFRNLLGFFLINCRSDEWSLSEFHLSLNFLTVFCCPKKDLLFKTV